MKVREATKEDALQMVSLMEQLGYPTTLEQFEPRFEKIFSHTCYHTLVAEFEDHLVGMAGLCTNLFYEYDGSYVRIVAFVVDSNYRRKGIGKKLMKEIESWARDQGVNAIALNSGNRKERKDAHQFYLSMGFEAQSIGYGKALT
ncbi:GNAT family N-acetyltransferase [Pseudalkalibacillus sp. Hm43]|uniref:GNAT family N-acetyltransferase n=1 Tax=Pseudalkalibacillus sp. Hm43 TaxID=3450742 RepID=UPI003F42CC1D